MTSEVLPYLQAFECLLFHKILSPTVAFLGPDGSAAPPLNEIICLALGDGYYYFADGETEAQRGLDLPLLLAGASGTGFLADC